MQILLTVAYDGTGYAGWQRQTNGIAVQQVMEETLARLLSQNVTLRSASRTDAGVHAQGQRAAFFAEEMKIPLNKLPDVVNAALPPDISVSAAEVVADGFNPRHAKSKTYIYQIRNAKHPDPLTGRYSAFVKCALDIGAMREAAAHILGRRDFSAFRAATPDNAAQSPVREVYSCEVGSCEISGGRQVTITVAGNAFLYNMVRIIAGTLVYAGLGKISAGEMPGIIESGDRTRAGKTMPPQGLTLMEVVYGNTGPNAGGRK
ncbi:MAG: tRNA pseudouridine(38-40) synthase TruA [Defluviitaleaceae bacterium]|nr:tRNA pseudouridine(38-40) synthase TruA [Defluviitaleaceae bacterium]